MKKVATGSWAYDGNINTPKTWGNLSMKEKADIMKVAVQNGITNLQDIRDRYNDFAEGGDLTDDEYFSIMEKVAKENWKDWGDESEDAALVRILNDNSYDYRGYYNKYPESEANAETHWSDEFKTVYHPTFSDESIYSGNKSKFNPDGLIGGHWEGEHFIPAPWQEDENEYSSGGKIHIKPSHRGRFTELKKRTGHSASWFKAHGTPAQKKMAVFALNSKKWKHGDGGPLVDAANAHIYDGTTEDSQQMNDDYIFTGRPSQYDFQVTAEAPTVYWDGFNWIGFNDLGQRVTKGSNFNPSGARVIESPQEFENARLAQARKTDINGTHRFAEKVRGVATLAAMAPMAGPLVEAADAMAPVILRGTEQTLVNPKTYQQLLTSILGGEAVETATKRLTGKSWEENVSKDIEEITGWNPQNTWYGKTLVAASNPGYLLSYNNIAKTAEYPLNVTKRLGEAVARTDIVNMKEAYKEAINAIKEGFTGIPKTKYALDPKMLGYVPYSKKRLLANTNYVLTGQKVGIPGYSNSFAPQVGTYIAQNKGFWHVPKGLEDADDVIDAFLYSKEIDPRFGLKLVNRGNDFGVHEQYVAKNYATKASDIPVYEVQNEINVPTENMVDFGIWKSADHGNTKLFSADGIHSAVDVGGHQVRIGKAKDGTTASQGQDIYKFNATDFDKKYHNLMSPVKRKAMYVAAKAFDALGTPVITRSKWVPMTAKTVAVMPESNLSYAESKEIASALKSMSKEDLLKMIKNITKE